MNKKKIEEIRAKIRLKNNLIEEIRTEIDSLETELHTYENLRRKKVEKYFKDESYFLIQRVITGIDKKIKFNGYTTDFCGRLILFAIINDKNCSIIYNFDCFKFLYNSSFDKFDANEREILNKFRDDATEIFDSNFKE